MAIRPQKTSQRYFRYYLWTEGVLWKIPAKLHRALLSGEIALTKYANSKQKILEVEITKAPAARIVSLNGTVYSFNSSGHVDLAVQANAVSLWITGSAPIKTDEVIDISNLLRHRHWQRTQTWTPPEAVKMLIKNHIEGRETKTHIRSLQAD